MHLQQAIAETHGLLDYENQSRRLDEDQISAIEALIDHAKKTRTDEDRNLIYVVSWQNEGSGGFKWLYYREDAEEYYAKTVAQMGRFSTVRLLRYDLTSDLDSQLEALEGFIDSTLVEAIKESKPSLDFNVTVTFHPRADQPLDEDQIATALAHGLKHYGWDFCGLGITKP